MITIKLELNGDPLTLEVAPRETLADVVRDRCNLTGTHLGCEHGACGACTVSIDGTVARSCIVLAVMAAGCKVETIEGTRTADDMNVIRRHFHEKHALQCGFCTPGMLMMARDIISRYPKPTEEIIRAQLSGQICRCTGYAGIVSAIKAAAEELAAA
jgi:aerobic-type carbon monoxide dehydrogenase small subunit (CoxS/CutS family)